MNHSERHFYRVRESYNLGRKGPAQAARFIYLNAACFNGIFRVNKAGEFNVPFGDRTKLLLPTSRQLQEFSKVLNSATLRSQDYSFVETEAEKGDFIYLDPPYPPLNGTSFFTHYTKNRFGAEDQEEVAALYAVLSKRGCLVMLSNADTPQIRKLYKGFKMAPITVPRYVTAKRAKHSVGELVITNYS